MKKLMILCCLLGLILSGCAKAGYEQTAATEQALETYYAAVKESQAATDGKITVNISLEDTAVTKKTTKERYEYSYTVTDNAEQFDYRCYGEDDALVSHYATTDENTVVDKLTGAAVDNFEGYKSHKTNPMSNLTLFRMDANYSVRHDTISSILMEQSGEDTLITVTFHGDKLTSQSIKSEGGLTRTVISHKRIYTVRDGKIARIEIYDRENALYQNETGVMNTDTVVEVSYQ